MVSFFFDDFNQYIVEWNGVSTFNAYQFINCKRELITMWTSYEVKDVNDAFTEANGWVIREYNGEHYDT